MILGTQLYITPYSMREQVTPVYNQARPSLLRKPQPGTGLWTSTYDEETGSAWVEWCTLEEFGKPYTMQWYLLTPREDTRVYMIESQDDLLCLMEMYPYGTQLSAKEAVRDILHEAELWQVPTRVDRYVSYIDADIDFERMALDYDALHLTDEAARALHLSMPIDLNSWDVESTLWFRWCFSSVQRIEPKIREEV